MVVVIEKTTYGKTPEGKTVDQYILRNVNGMEVGIITYGGRITFLTAPDKDGTFENVVLNLENLDEYLHEKAYFGAVVGRYGNRIASGKFSLDGKIHKLATNDGQNHLHGGFKGFDKVVWNAEVVEESHLKLTYLSKNKEEGYPGNLQVKVVYRLDEDNSLHVEYTAVSDAKTVINLTQHSYFNLSADFSKVISDHYVQINADTFLPVDKEMIPTGIFAAVENTPFDFRKEKEIGRDISAKVEQLKLAKGYDHTFVLKEGEDEEGFAASAHHRQSGRKLQVFTTEPGIQFYTANFLDGTLPRPEGEGVYKKRSGFCFETQHFPDSPNRPKFPSVVLEPDEKFSSKTIFRFSAE